MPEPFVPKATPESAPFWDAAARRELVMQRARSDGRYFFYPRGFVPGHPDDEFDWVPVSGRGVLVSYVIDHRPFPGFEHESPVIALVRLVEGPRMMTNIVGVEPVPENLPIGAPVRVAFRQRGAMTLPIFELDDHAGNAT
jgi:hypothetical protein